MENQSDKEWRQPATSWTGEKEDKRIWIEEENDHDLLTDEKNPGILFITSLNRAGVN